MNFFKKIFGSKLAELSLENRFDSFKNCKAQGILLIPNTKTQALETIFINSIMQFDTDTL